VVLTVLLLFRMVLEVLAKPLRVDLTEARSFPDGTVIHVYQPTGATGNA
jgi:hypothetical protein